MPIPDLEGYRKNDKEKFEENQNYSAEELHHKPDHPSSFMNMIKSITHAMSATNDERSQVLPARVIWDGSTDRFVVFRSNFEGHCGQIGAGHLFDSSFQEAYLKMGIDCNIDFWMKYHLLHRSRKMHGLYMTNYLVHVRAE
jgi:hypothetical protein